MGIGEMQNIGPRNTIELRRERFAVIMSYRCLVTFRRKMED